MAKHRTHSIALKRQVVQEYLAGETLHGLARRHELSRTLIRIWVDKYEAGAFDEDAEAASTIQEYEARIAALERLVGKQALELEFLKGALSGKDGGREARPCPLSPAQRPLHRQGCRLMGIARSTYYDQPKGSADGTALVEAMHAIKDEFEAYGWRRMQAALRHRGWVVNHKKIRRLMREHAMHPPCRRRFVATTDSDHDEPVFPDRSRDCEIEGPNQLWVADLTYIAILGGFVYLAAIMDAWSRRITGYALGRRIDARLTLAALTTAIENRNPPPGCIHHSDRGSQYAAQAYRALLTRIRPGRLDGTARQPLRQRHDGEMEWTPPTPMPSGARAQVDPRGPTASRC